MCNTERDDYCVGHIEIAPLDGQFDHCPGPISPVEREFLMCVAYDAIEIQAKVCSVIDRLHVILRNAGDKRLSTLILRDKYGVDMDLYLELIAQAKSALALNTTVCGKRIC